LIERGCPQHFVGASLPDRVHVELTEQRIPNWNGIPTGDDFSSPPQVFDGRYPSTAVSFAAPQKIRGRPTAFPPLQSDTFSDTYNAPGNFDGRQSLSPRTPKINADKEAPNEPALQSTQSATPSKPITPP
jgi:hypothetical protein